MKNYKRVDIIYRGKVQGVGFRFAVMGFAVKLHVTGFVKNLPDESVQLVAEGLKTELETLLRQINLEMSGYINDTKIKWSDSLGEYSIFKIEY